MDLTAVKQYLVSKGAIAETDAVVGCFVTYDELFKDFYKIVKKVDKNLGTVVEIFPIKMLNYGFFNVLNYTKPNKLQCSALYTVLTGSVDTGPFQFEIEEKMNSLGYNLSEDRSYYIRQGFNLTLERATQLKPISGAVFSIIKLKTVLKETISKKREVTPSDILNVKAELDESCKLSIYPNRKFLRLISFNYIFTGFFINSSEIESVIRRLNIHSDIMELDISPMFQGSEGKRPELVLRDFTSNKMLMAKNEWSREFGEVFEQAMYSLIKLHESTVNDDMNLTSDSRLSEFSSEDVLASLTPLSQVFGVDRPANLLLLLVSHLAMWRESLDYMFFIPDFKVKVHVSPRGDTKTDRFMEWVNLNGVKSVNSQGNYSTKAYIGSVNSLTAGCSSGSDEQIVVLFGQERVVTSSYYPFDVIDQISSAFNVNLQIPSFVPTEGFKEEEFNVKATVMSNYVSSSGIKVPLLAAEVDYRSLNRSTSSTNTNNQNNVLTNLLHPAVDILPRLSQPPSRVSNVNLVRQEWRVEGANQVGFDKRNFNVNSEKVPTPEELAFIESSKGIQDEGDDDDDDN